MRNKWRCPEVPGLVWVALSAFVGVGAERAEACGGLFCSQGSPTPVDQAAERILFEVLDDGSVSATVEIKYQGNPNEFSWIVPVSGTPSFVDVAGKDELQLLDQATAPQLLPPRLRQCDIDGEASSEGEGEAGGEGEGEAGGVTVIEYPSVGPFDDIVVVEGGDAGVLMAWLQDHGYRVTDRMRPFIEQYTVEGYKFLATRLRADADVQDMVPIRFHCPQPNPEIPLRLTAIAAEPEMGFLIFIAGPRRYAPLNYQELILDESELRMGFDPQFNIVNNYFALVSKKLDEIGGQGFVVERAQPASAVLAALSNVGSGFDGEGEAEGAPDSSRAHLEEVLGSRAFVTRLYARLNPEEMTVDPIFSPRGAGPEADVVVDGVLDLSGQTTGACFNLDPAPLCGTLYCGPGAGCGQTALGEGCVCSGNTTARTISAPTGGQQISCASPDIDLHDGGDPCAAARCGNGSCVAVNDRPTCRCDPGSAAVIDGGGVRCVALVDDRIATSGSIIWPTFGSTGAEPGGSDDEVVDVGFGVVFPRGGCGGCATSDGNSVAVTALLLALLRRRRRRSAP